MPSRVAKPREARPPTEPDRFPTPYPAGHLIQLDLAPEAPANFILGWTLERIYLPHKSRLCARVEGKSSFARMGLGVHVTAPTVHAGWGHNKDNDQDHGARLRLEIWNVGPIPVQLVKGMRICQLIVEEVREVPSAGYSGQFNMQAPKPPESK